MMSKQKTSIHLSYLLRHAPEAAELDMDRHGWVSVSQLMSNVNSSGKAKLTTELLQEIVAPDNKGRYRFSADGKRIKACQGHSIPWVEPELEVRTPPEYLYHGTTTEALQDIMKSGAILRMSRHAVHMQEDVSKAWQSAEWRKNKTPVVLKIAAEKMSQDEFVFSISENGVWFCEQVPTGYICEFLYTKESKCEQGGSNMIEAIAKRKSIRSFADKKVEPEKVESLLRAAMRAPSGINGQPWEFVVVDDREVLTAMQKLSPGGRALQTAPLAIVVLEKAIPFRVEKGLSWLGQQDLGACTENILLLAVEEGLGAGWMGIGPETPGQAALAELLDLPENVKPYSIVGIGYPAEDADLAAVDRFDATRIHYNHY